MRGADTATPFTSGVLEKEQELTSFVFFTPFPFAIHFKWYFARWGLCYLTGFVCCVCCQSQLVSSTGIYAKSHEPIWAVSHSKILWISS